jgi:hypothetical protein
MIPAIARRNFLLFLQVAPERKQTWMQDRAAIRYGWDYDDK